MKVSIKHFLTNKKFTKLLWLQIKFKIHLKTKLNIQGESNTMEDVKGNERTKLELGDKD